MSSKSIHTLLNQDNKLLKTILSTVKQLELINEKVKAILPEDLKDLCQVANLRQGILVLQVNSGAAATRLRYQIPEILTTLRQKNILPGLISIEYIVR